MRSALITGISGQDGSYLAELLLEKGYTVHGLVRSTSGGSWPRIAHLISNPKIKDRRLVLHLGDLAQAESLRAAVREAGADEVYHLAGQSDVGMSFREPELTCDVVGLGTVRLLEVLRELRNPPKVFHASSSHIFGDPQVAPQDEETPVRPLSPYACAKAFATQMVRMYRQRHGLFACNGILYNHESPRRGASFVTQKICLAAAAIKRGEQQELRLGNIDAQRDWGDARNYVEGMWLSLQAPEADDYVFATGQLHTVKDVLEIAFEVVGLDWRQYVRQDPELMRAEESGPLVGNPGKAQRALKWRTTTDFAGLIREMTAAALQRERPPG